MQILVVGGGGREHTLTWKLAQSPHVERLFVAPGNGGTDTLPKTENIAISATDLAALVDFAREQRIDLTVVGPEAPLVAGIVDRFQVAGLPIFGPTQAAAQLEGSKAFAKQFMRRHGIPTAQAVAFDEYEAALDYLHTLAAPPVIKASGLAAGKGVTVPQTMTEAVEAVRAMLLDHRFGAASETVLLEERLTGPELSVLAFCDGATLHILPPAQDHKRLLDGDQGPNTGGMGAFAPSPLATSALLAQVEQTILRPTLAGIAAAGTPYTGVLYAGLMLTSNGPQVIEFNCRLGDPETQAILPLLDSDLVEILLACVNGQLDQVQPSWRNQIAVSVVMAAGGYPDAYATGEVITGIEEAETLGCQVFQAGTQRQNGQLVTAGGRVLNVTALGETITSAAQQAYAGVAKIHFAQAQFRRDIGRT
jgi:phosphoribosylamine---glycine ligase